MADHIDYGKPVNTGKANHTQTYPRTVHADGSPSDDFEVNMIDRCPDCHALNTITVIQQGYGDLFSCSACGGSRWYDRGD